MSHAISDLRLEFEWQDPREAKGEELRATWASFSIYIDDKAVTKLEDKRTKSVRTSVFLPLFPVAEWLADNWWFLHSEAERSGVPERKQFDRRHNLRWARDGFALPWLRFTSIGENVEATWSPHEIPGVEIRFLADGRVILPRDAFSQTLRDFVNKVVTRLDDCGVSNTTLHEQWSAIQGADADERDFCQAAARLGVDPYAVDDELQAAILAFAAKVPSELVSEFFSLAEVDKLHDQGSQLISAANAIASDTDTVDALAAVRGQAPQLENHSNPWQCGYRFAIALRGRLNSGNWKSRSLAELAGHLRVDQLDRCLLPAMDRCPLLDALTGSNRLGNPKFLIEKKLETSRQFVFCRALFEYLTATPGSLASVSRLRTERQQRNRAFAAEFLAPHRMLREDLSGSSVGEDEIEALAMDYGVSPFVIGHQIKNHRLAEVVPSTGI